MTKELSPEVLQRRESLLYDLNMGYYKVTGITPFTGVQWFAEENEFYHPFSFEEQGKKYGYNKLQEVIPLIDYMSLPTFMVDELINGITKGKDLRFKHDALKNPEGDQDAQLTSEMRKANEQLERVLRRQAK